MDEKKLLIIKLPNDMKVSEIHNVVNRLNKSIGNKYQLVFISDKVEVINYENDKDLIIATVPSVGNITLQNIVEYLKNEYLEEDKE